MGKKMMLLLLPNLDKYAYHRMMMVKMLVSPHKIIWNFYLNCNQRKEM